MDIKDIAANTATISMTEKLVADVAVSCLICGESISVPAMRATYMVCDKCKEAVMKVRAELEGDKE